MSWIDRDSHTRRRPPRLWSIFKDHQLIGSFAIAVCTLGAGFFTGALGGPTVGIGIQFKNPRPTITITRVITRTVTALASPSTSPSTPSSPPQPSPTPTMPLLKPIVNETGWVLAWHTDVSIGPQGIILGTSRPEPSNGKSFDLQYVPGGSGWNDNGCFDYWQKPYRPGPAIISGLTDNGCNNDVGGTQAHVGDHLYTELGDGAGASRIAYMQVVAVRAANVVVDIWVWNIS